MSTVRVLLVGVLALSVTASLSPALAPPSGKSAAASYRVSPAFTHDNLTIFFLHGEDQIKGKKILTLDEALKAKKVVVHETRNVNQLAIENVSDDDVFVQAGDIVKGGQQDRTIALDVIVPARSKRIPLASFCVEQRRWSKRGAEDATTFSRSVYALAGKDLKLAARSARSQGQVWRDVGKTQDRLGMILKSEVKDLQSATSLQLTLEHKKLQEALNGYIQKLQPALGAKMTDVVGFAVVINGQVASADVYANADLFRKLWAKLLRASAIEALAEKSAAKFAPAKREAVTAFLNEVASGKRTERKTVHDMSEIQMETTRNILFETTGEKGIVLRRSYLAK